MGIPLIDALYFQDVVELQAFVEVAEVGLVSVVYVYLMALGQRVPQELVYLVEASYPILKGYTPGGVRWHGLMSWLLGYLDGWQAGWQVGIVAVG